jgi:tetratricopeptide (TPR) repeat protein
MKSTILVTAAMLATTMLAAPTAVKPAAANRGSEESGSIGMVVSQNFYNGEGSDEFAAIVIIAGVAVAFTAALGGSSKRLAISKPASKSPHSKPTAESKPEPRQSAVNSVPLNQSDTSSSIALPDAQFKQGNRGKAIEYFNEAILRNPNSASLYGERANFRKKNLGDNQGAIEDYNEAIRLQPHNALFYFWRSQTYYDLGNRQTAIEDYNEAMRLAPEDTMYYCFQSASKEL